MNCTQKSSCVIRTNLTLCSDEESVIYRAYRKLLIKIHTLNELLDTNCLS